MGLRGTVPIPEVSAHWETKGGGEYIPTYQVDQGVELTMVYVGSSSCTYSNMSFMPETVIKIKTKLSRRLGDKNVSFSTIGIATDWITRDGIEHLRKFGTFDQVISGRNWYNIGVRKLFWNGLGGRPSTPQILVIGRYIKKSGIAFDISDKIIVVQKIGPQNIRDWLKSGVPMRNMSDIVDDLKKGA